MKATRIILLLLISITMFILISCAGGQTSGSDSSQGVNGDQDANQGADATLDSGQQGDMEQQVSITDIQKGLKVWLNSGCTNCHRIGDDQGGDIGPALTDIGDRFTYQQLAAWIRNPQSVKPDSNMPAQNLSDEDLDFLARYLSMLSSDTENTGTTESRGIFTPGTDN
ncbi:MAG: c-type cytochrome [bacterium]|nr:c-type cytochrome [bacterium]